MADLFGVTVPTVDITGYFASTWFYVLIVGIIGFILVATLFTILFFRTYNKKCIFFENVSGLGFQPVMRKRARVVKLGTGDEEIMRLMGGGNVSAYGRKMGKNTYWFAKGLDGYWYNIILADLDAKKAILDVEPVDKDVRMFHVAKGRQIQYDYSKKNFMEKYGTMMVAFVFLVILLLGMWFIVGKVGDATNALTETAKINADIAETTKDLLIAQENIKSGSGITKVGG